MDAVVVQIQHEPARENVRDRRGIIIGTIEHQRHVGRLIARDGQGVLVGHYDQRSRTTRDAHGRLLGRTNLLPALLFRRR